MKSLRKLTKSAVALTLALTMTFGARIPGEAVYAANEKASSVTELATLFNKHGVARDKKFSIDYTGSSKDIENIVLDPELSFLLSTITLVDDPSTSDDADYLAGNLNLSGDFDLYAEGNTITFDMRYFETSPQTQYVNDNVPRILSDLGVSGMSNYDKVKTIHDYVCGLITYVDDVDNASTMYSAIATGNGLCNSYALCMYKLLVEAGVPCKFIGGTAGTGRDAGGHAWNIVALGDKWYNLDATWDDMEDGVSYDYFLKGSSDFDSVDPSQAHTMDKPYRTGDFAAQFPVTKSRFVKGSNDVNSSVTIGGGTAIADTSGTDSDEYDDVTYTLKQIVEGTYPGSKKFSVKKGKLGELQLYISKDYVDVIDSVKYKVTSGKANIKSIKNNGLCVDGGDYFTDLTFKGKKKGKVKIQIILGLTNGQKLKVTFSGKIK